MSTWFFRSERLNLLTHCSRFGRLEARDPGWTVLNDLIPTRLFNFHTGWEGIDAGELARRSAAAQLGRARTVLWSSYHGGDPAAAWRHHLTYRVVALDTRASAGNVQCATYWSPAERPQQLAERMAAAHREPRTLPYFRLLVDDPGVIVIDSGHGALVVRPAYGVAGVYDLAVQPEARGQGHGSALLAAAANVAYRLGMPAIAHVRPDSYAWRGAARAGYKHWFDDDFFALA
jgi:GNAT superfamily N-acetyltransferase